MQSAGWCLAPLGWLRPKLQELCSVPPYPLNLNVTHPIILADMHQQCCKKIEITCIATIGVVL